MAPRLTHLDATGAAHMVDVSDKAVTSRMAIAEGAVSLAWRSDTFAFAEGYDETAGRYIGLRGGAHVSVTPESGALLVKPSAAERQMEADAKPFTPPVRPDDRPGGGGKTPVDPPFLPPKDVPGTGETGGGSSPRPPAPPQGRRAKQDYPRGQRPGGPVCLAPRGQATPSRAWRR